jgi:hypothetical protein
MRFPASNEPETPMTPKSLLAAAPAALLVLASTRAPADEVSFHPDAGARVTRTFETRSSFQLEEFVQSVNGQERSPDELPEYVVRSRETIVVNDVFVTLADGRPGELQRTFTTLSNSTEQGVGDETQETEEESELEGATVVFRWDSDEDEYAIEFEDGEGDTDLLAELEEDMDLRGFLPADEVSEGEAWDVPTAAWVALQNPGGNLHLEGESDTDEEREMSKSLRDNWETELRAEYKGQRDVDGTTLGVIRVTGEASTSGELDLESHVRGVAVSVDVELELLWNPARGLMHSLSGTSEVEIRQTENGQVEQGDQTLDISLERIFAGDLELAVTLESL